MRIGGYRLEDVVYGIKVTEHEAGWHFWLQGDDAQQFREDWAAAEDVGVEFRYFLSYYDYDTLFA